MAFCTSPLSEQECHNDTSCIYLEEKSYHPFSILNEDGVGVKVEDDTCPGTYEKNKNLEQYIEKCLKIIPSIFPGNNSMDLQFSSPKYTTGLYKHCWDCAQAENFDHCFVSKLTSTKLGLGQLKDSIYDPQEKQISDYNNCDCKKSWTFVREDGEAKDFVKCDKTIVDFDDTTTLPWCYTNKSCKHARKGNSGEYWNYCTPPDDAITKQKQKPNPCLCKPFWKHNGEWYTGCDSRHPERDRPWCYIGTNQCPTANDPFGKAWVYCDSNSKQEEIVSRQNKCNNGIPKISNIFDYKSQNYNHCEICNDESELVKENYEYYKTNKTEERIKCTLKEVNTVIGQGRGYRGTLNTTKSGRVCQSWDKSEPHDHKHGFKYETTGHNFCRNPDNSESIWCYTNDPNKRREYCDIKEANKQKDNESFYDGDAWSDKLLDFEFSDEAFKRDDLCEEISGRYTNLNCTACGTKLYFNKTEISTNNLNNCLVTSFFNDLKDKVLLPILTDEDEKCKCMDTWLYDDKEYFGCDERQPGESSPWCYVDEACQSARRSKSGKFWKYCQLDNDPCTCKKQWSYEGELFSGCDERKPGKDDPWCVVDGFSCPTAKQDGNQFWTFCTPEKSNACNCQKSWSSENQTYSLCGAVEGDKKWCFVNDVACETTDGTKDAKPFKFCTEIGGECTDDSTCALGKCKTKCCKIAAANDKNCEECDANGNCGKCVENFVYKKGEGCVSKYQNKCTNGFKNIPPQKDGEDCQSCKYGYIKEGDTCIHEITHDHVKGIGTGYRGILNKYDDAEYNTQECNPWNLYENTKDLEHNFYRNPDNDPKGVWCYTKKGEKIYPRKDDLLNFYKVVEEKGIHYNGNINTTLTGRSCARWNDNSVHEHDVETTFQHNFCRNPNGDKDTIWCYTNDKKVPWEYCTVPDDAADDRVYFEKFYLLPNRHCFRNDRVFATMKKFGSKIPVAECIQKCKNSETCNGITYDEDTCMLCTSYKDSRYYKDSIVYEKFDGENCKSNTDCKDKHYFTDKYFHILLPNCIHNKEDVHFRFARCDVQNFDTGTFCESHDDCRKREYCQTNNLCNNVSLCYANSITGECPKECEAHTDCEGRKYCTFNFECEKNTLCTSDMSIDSTCPNECESHNDCGWPKEDQVCLKDDDSYFKMKTCQNRLLSCETRGGSLAINDNCPQCSSHDDCSKESYCSTTNKCVSHDLCSYSNSMLKSFDNNCPQKPKECESHEDCGWPDKENYCTNEYKCKPKYLCDKNNALNNQCPRECESHEDCGWPDKLQYCTNTYDCEPKYLCDKNNALNNQCPRECESHEDCGWPDELKYCTNEYECKPKYLCDGGYENNALNNQCPRECESHEECGETKFCTDDYKCELKHLCKEGGIKYRYIDINIEKVGVKYKPIGNQCPNECETDDDCFVTSIASGYKAYCDSNHKCQEKKMGIKDYKWCDEEIVVNENPQPVLTSETAKKYMSRKMDLYAYLEGSDSDLQNITITVGEQLLTLPRIWKDNTEMLNDMYRPGGVLEQHSIVPSHVGFISGDKEEDITLWTKTVGSNTTYVGTQNKSISGKTCAYWATSIYEDEMKQHIDGGVDEDISHKDYIATASPWYPIHNYCRNPNNDPKGIWCYTKRDWDRCEQEPTPPGCEKYRPDNWNISTTADDVDFNIEYCEPRADEFTTTNKLSLAGVDAIDGFKDVKLPKRTLRRVETDGVDGIYCREELLMEKNPEDVEFEFVSSDVKKVECESHTDCDEDKYCRTDNRCQLITYCSRHLAIDKKCPIGKKECESHTDCDNEDFCSKYNTCSLAELCTEKDSIDGKCPILNNRECESHTDCGWPDKDKYCSISPLIDARTGLKETKCLNIIGCSIVNNAIDEKCPIKKECDSHTDCGWPKQQKYCTKEQNCQDHVMCSIFNNAVDGKCPKGCESHTDCGWPETKAYCNTTNKCEDNMYCSFLNDAIDQTCPETKANEVIVEGVDVKEDKKEGECNSHEACGWPTSKKYCTSEMKCDDLLFCSIYGNSIDNICHDYGQSSSDGYSFLK